MNSVGKYLCARLKVVQNGEENVSPIFSYI